LVELRERGIADVGQVELGILEPEGRLSFLVETGGAVPTVLGSSAHAAVWSTLDPGMLETW
jgi:uncharacterized membrane protein YcaP (DUF421 family)